MLGLSGPWPLTPPPVCPHFPSLPLFCPLSLSSAPSPPILDFSVEHSSRLRVGPLASQGLPKISPPAGLPFWPEPCSSPHSQPSALRAQVGGSGWERGWASERRICPVSGFFRPLQNSYAPHHCAQLQGRNQWPRDKKPSTEELPQPPCPQRAPAAQCSKPSLVC